MKSGTYLNQFLRVFLPTLRVSTVLLEISGSKVELKSLLSSLILENGPVLAIGWEVFSPTFTYIRQALGSYKKLLSLATSSLH